MPREDAQKRYWKASERAKRALDRDLEDLKKSRTHRPGWPQGSYPNNAVEARREAHPDWPYIRYTKYLNKSLGAYKRVEHGVARHKNRPSKPQNSNDEIIALLRKCRPHDFMGRFGVKSAEETRRWLERRKIYKSTDAITKMINRAKKLK